MDVDRVARKPLVVCPPVLTEAVFLLDHPVQRRRLERLLLELPVLPWPNRDEPAFWRDVFAWLTRYEEHQPDWADGYLVIAATRVKGARVWTYDREFRTTWRRLDGKRVPMALRS